MTVVLSPTEEQRFAERGERGYAPRERVCMSDDGASSSSSPSRQAVQTPGQAAEPLRLFGEAQHKHQAVIESIDGQAAGDDEHDDEDEHELGMCNAQEVSGIIMHATLRSQRSQIGWPL